MLSADIGFYVPTNMNEINASIDIKPTGAVTVYDLGYKPQNNAWPSAGISWQIKFRNGNQKRFIFPVTKKRERR